MNLSSLEKELSNLGERKTLVTAMAACEPQGFYSALCENMGEITGLRIFCANPTRPYAVFTESLSPNSIEIRPMFLTRHVSMHQERAHIHYVPQHLSQWVENIKRQNNIDIFWGTCSPPDMRGFVNLGPSASYEPEILRSADRVILEINENLPITFGSTWIDLKQVDTLIENNTSIPTIPMIYPDDVDQRIAERIANLVEDGSTLQFGIGSIPNALGEALKNKKDLGSIRK